VRSFPDSKNDLSGQALIPPAVTVETTAIFLDIALILLSHSPYITYDVAYLTAPLLTKVGLFQDVK
jgi:hypothetical protein